MALVINSFKGKYYFLSNFFNAPLEYNGLKYKNNEAAFQAQKCRKKEDMVKFVNMNPSEAKKAGRMVNLRPDWEDVKEQIMYEIVKAKFNQNTDLALMLFETKDAILIEGNNWGDKIWGQVDGVGQNLLGKILMKIRDEMCLKIIKIGEKLK